NALTSSITKEGLEFSVNNKYLFLQGYFLLWQAKELSIASDFEQAEKALQQTISVAEQIQLEDLISSASTSLAGLYHINNYDRESLAIAQKFLAQRFTSRKDRIISFLHVAGLSSFNLKYYDLADYYLKESLKLSEELKDSKAIAKSYMFLSLTLAEKKNFSESSMLSSKAFEAAHKLKDDTSRLNTLFMISAYYGKTKLLAGEFAEAAKAYQEALDINQELGKGFQNNLPLAQLNEGLATALIATGESTKAQPYLQMAKSYKKSSITNKEATNCLLAFIPNSCYDNKK
ncbi:MAG: tetratricopeptide repeat protein, partial [Blastocatellia bacterium]